MQHLTLPERNGIGSAMLIYKILTPDQWDELQAKGQTQGAPIDVEDGYIHFSTDEQVRETATKHFATANTLILLACDTDLMGTALRWEASRGGALFPHLYDLLKRDYIKKVETIERLEGTHLFPSYIP